MQIDIEIYETPSGKRPFEGWIRDVCDRSTRSVILARIDRLKVGNFGDCKALKDGVYELRIHCGPGVRVYYSKIGSMVILLLCGGDKSSQEKDITKAKEYLKEFQSREIKHGKK